MTGGWTQATPCLTYPATEPPSLPAHSQLARLSPPLPIAISKLPIQGTHQGPAERGLAWPQPGPGELWNVGEELPPEPAWPPVSPDAPPTYPAVPWLLSGHDFPSSPLHRNRKKEPSPSASSSRSPHFTLRAARLHRALQRVRGVRLPPTGSQGRRLPCSENLKSLCKQGGRAGRCQNLSVGLSLGS